MKRKDVLKGMGVAGLATLLPVDKPKAAIPKDSAMKLHDAGACVLIPTETAGPLSPDLTAKPTCFRQDIKESKTGVQFNLTLKITGVNTAPMQKIRADTWH